VQSSSSLEPALRPAWTRVVFSVVVSVVLLLGFALLTAGLARFGGHN